MCIKKDILRILTYFNMFDYPLKNREIFTFLGHRVGLNEFEDALNKLIDESAIFKMGDLYSTDNNAALVERRYKGNAKAVLLLKKAEKAAAIIAAFPFVKGVAVSGSLSKNFADENADIDFFIITATNRLWITRTMLHAFKKFTYLFNKQHFYCMNYFVDEAGLCILEKNIYTAVEVVTVMPLRGKDIFEKFFKINNWTKNFFPNHFTHLFAPKETTKTWFRHLIEKSLDNRLGNALDTFLMNLTARSWDLKTLRKKKNSKGLLMSMHTGKHFSKPNPAQFQKKLLQRYEKSISEVFNWYDMRFRVKNKSV